MKSRGYHDRGDRGVRFSCWRKDCDSRERQMTWWSLIKKGLQRLQSICRVDVARRGVKRRIESIGSAAGDEHKTELGRIYGRELVEDLLQGAISGSKNDGEGLSGFLDKGNRITFDGDDGVWRQLMGYMVVEEGNGRLVSRDGIDDGKN